MEAAHTAVVRERRQDRDSGFELRAPARADEWQSALKRALDVTGAATFLLLFLPLLLAVAALALALQGRPLLYGHARIGRGGRKFRCYKFRTMVRDGDKVFAEHLARDPQARREWETTRKLRNDPRVTPLGRTMRKLSLDELPQFLNVLSGEMSLVGPRPVVEQELTHYGAHAETYCSVRPGITGLWQVSGRSDTSYEQRVRLDVDYVRDWSLGRDIVILVKTVPAVLSSSGSC